MDMIVPFTVLGVGAGGLYAMAALGLVLIHRASGVVNFAQGSIGMVGAYVYFELYVEHEVGWPLAMAGAFAGSAAVGVLFHLLVMRRLRDASALTKIAATIALLIALQGVAMIRYGAFPKFVPSLLPNEGIELFGNSVGEDRVYIFCIAIVLTGVLWVVYRFTTFGVATAAVAENQRAAAALAVSPNAVAAVNWAIGSALGALASVLLVPITSLEPTSASFLVIPVLAAAVIGRFSSFPLTTAAGIVIGVAQALVPQYWHQPGVGTAIPFALVALVLILRGRSVVAKDERFGRMPAIGTGRVAPGLVAVGAGAGLICIWWLFGDEWLDALQVQLVVMVVLLSFVVVTGYAGQVSLAQGAFAGIGALITGRLHVSHGWSLVPAVLVGVLAVIPVAAVVGLAGVRTRSVNLAIVTLGFAIAVGPVVFLNPDYTGGALGLRVKSLSVLGIDLDPADHAERYATFTLLVLVGLSLVVANLRRGRAGRRLIAVRTNERAAAALGVSVVEAKLFAFVVGGAIAAVGGILIVYRQSVLDFRGFGGLTSLFLLQNAVIGGVGSLAGPIAGSSFQPGTVGQQLSGYLPGDPALVLTIIGGFGLLVLLSFAPDGLAELQRRQFAPVMAFVRRRLPRRPPPSDRLLAALDAHEQSRVAPMFLSTRGLTVRFGGASAVEELDIEVHPGEVVGLIGPNGAGKSTAIEAITGFVKPTAGQVFLGDEPIDGWSRERRARAGLGRSFQSLELFDDLTVLENIQAACDRRDRGAYLTDLVWPGHGRLTSAARSAIADFGLEGVLDTKAMNLGYADRRMLAVARAVAASSSVLLLDEPASGLDDVQSRRLGVILRRLADQRGVAVLLVEHNVDLVFRSCDRVYALSSGWLVASGPPSVVRADPLVIESYLGTSGLRGAT